MKSSFRKFYGRNHELNYRSRTSISLIITDTFQSSLTQSRTPSLQSELRNETCPQFCIKMRIMKVTTCGAGSAFPSRQSEITPVFGNSVFSCLCCVLFTVVCFFVFSSLCNDDVSISDFRVFKSRCYFLLLYEIHNKSFKNCTVFGKHLIRLRCKCIEFDKSFEQSIQKPLLI